MSARGAADFLTRSTAILATAFIVMSIVLAVIAATRHNVSIDTSLRRAPAPASAPAAAPTAPAPAAPAAPAPANGQVPLAQ